MVFLSNCFFFFFISTFFTIEKKLNISKTNEILQKNNNKGIMVSQLAKMTNLFPDWFRSLNYEKGDCFDCIEREEDLKDPQRSNKVPR